jgi:hypothetical protein
MSTWHEIVVVGHRDQVRAFVLGFLAGRGGEGGVFGSDVDLEADSLGRRLRDLLAAGTHHAFFAPAATADALADAIATHGADLGLRVESRRRIDSAEVAFEVEVFSRELAQQVRTALLTDLPEGVRVLDPVEHETVDPEAKGVEMYAPAHDYRYRASGRVVGSFAGVLEMRRRARTIEFVNLKPLKVGATPIRA